MTPLLCCNDVQLVYDSFLAITEYYIAWCIPVNVVRTGLKDADYVTPIIRPLFNNGNRIRIQGNVIATDSCQNKYTVMIAEQLRNRLQKSN